MLKRRGGAGLKTEYMRCFSPSLMVSQKFSKILEVRDDDV
jgi:hypothetical protein